MLIRLVLKMDGSPFGFFNTKPMHTCYKCIILYKIARLLNIVRIQTKLKKETYKLPYRLKCIQIRNSPYYGY